MNKNIENLIKGFIENAKNDLKYKTSWNEPVVGFADTNDLLFLQLKKIVHKNHKLPKELLNQAKTVISYFIPFNHEIVSSNDKGKTASKEWAIAYIETNNLITELNEFLVKELKKDNFKSVKLPPTHNFDKNFLLSFWSHKHVSYIAGLGKFGLHKMIITDKGCCGRLGSLITSAKLEVTIRKEGEYCLYYHNKTCTKCIDKCFNSILNVKSFNRYRCYDVCLENGRIYSQLGFPDVCGKCVCGIPCSLKNPVR